MGYLAYDSESSEVFIPNTEIRGEFRNAVTGEHWKEVAAALETSDRLLQATWDGDAETVAELLDTAHMENTSILTYNLKSHSNYTLVNQITSLYNSTISD